MKKNSITYLFTLIFCCCQIISALGQEKEQLARLIISDLREGQAEQVYQKFDENLQSKITLEQVKTIWSSITLQAGPFEEIVKVEVEKADNLTRTISLCKFERAHLDISLVFNDDDQVSGIFFRPAEAPDSPQYQLPDYAIEGAYKETKLKLPTPVGELDGIYTSPMNVENPPVIVLVHGSGPNDMDETLGPNKLFKDLALGLSSKGVATIRYTKRTRAFPSSADDRSTVDDEVVVDALKAVEVAKDYSQGPVYVLGHSLGGMMAPKIAVESKGLAGIILMAGPARPIEELLINQVTYLRDNDAIAPGQKALYDGIYLAGQKLKQGDYDLSTPKSELLNVSPVYWKDLQAYKPLRIVKKVKVPILILQGARDYQVTLEDLELWRGTLKKKATYKTYDQLNHMFLEGKGVCLPSEYEVAGHVPTYVLQDILSWLER